MLLRHQKVGSGTHVTFIHQRSNRYSSRRREAKTMARHWSNWQPCGKSRRIMAQRSGRTAHKPELLKAAEARGVPPKKETDQQSTVS